MAKESMKARERKRQKMVAKYAAKRAALKEAGDYEGLQKLPKNASPVRLHNRCQLSGRPKGYMRQFGVSRINFREMALNGLIPGVKKASWQFYYNKYLKIKIKMVTDQIADYLTRVRNAVAAKHRVVEVPSSNLKKEMTKILYNKGYILSYKFVDEGVQKTIKIALKYHPETKKSAITSLVRISKPGLRKYTNSKELPRVLNGLGIAIISTSKGVISDKEARKLNVGGEVLCYVS